MTEGTYQGVDALRFELERPLLLLRGKKGVLACAYLSMETFNKTGEAAALVTGVDSFDDMMNAEVVAVSKAAEDLGVKVGAPGSEALNRFK